MKKVQMLLLFGFLAVIVHMGAGQKEWLMFVLTNDVLSIEKMFEDEQADKSDALPVLEESIALLRPDLVNYFLKRFSFSADDFYDDVSLYRNFNYDSSDAVKVRRLLGEHGIIKQRNRFPREESFGLNRLFMES